MGIDYRGQLCVGYTYEEVQELMDKAGFEGDYYDFIEQEGLSSFGPYFDADKEDCIYGHTAVQSYDYSFVEVDVDKVGGVARHLKDGLLIEYGIEPKAYIMAQGT